FSEGVLVTTKGSHENAVPLPPVLASILDAAIAGKGPGDRVVTLRTGETMSDRTVDKRLRRLQRKLGIAPVRSLHKLRHFGGQGLVRGGATRGAALRVPAL